MKTLTHIPLCALGLLLGWAGACAQGLLAPVSPGNGDTVAAPYPTFLWRADAAGAGVAYQLRLFEVLPGQAYQAAPLASPVYHSSGSLPAPFYLYPAAAAPLRAGGHYAWQLMRWVQDSPQPLYSEVWHFWVPVEEPAPEEPVEDAPAPPPAPGGFHLLPLRPTASPITVTDGCLRVVLPETYFVGEADSVLAFTLYSADGQPAYRNHTLAQVYGANRVEIRLDRLEGFQPVPGGRYEARFQDRQGRHYSVPFRVQPNPRER